MLQLVVYRGFWDSTVAAQIETLIRLAGNRNRNINNVAVGIDAARELALSGSRDVLFNIDNYNAFAQRREDPFAVQTP